MLSFSQFLKEAGDAALPYSHTVDSYYGDHVYGFKHKGVHYRVNIGHNARNGADVSFYADHSKAHGDIGITGTAGTSSTKILSTIHHIIKKHVEQHPHVDEVTFSSVNAEPTRVKLYSKYTEKLGGQNHRRSYDTDHIIPASSYRTQISESGETPLPFRFDGEHDEYDQRYHRYSFQHNGKPFRVNIAHHDAPFPTAFVNFADYSKRPDLGDMNVTGRARHGAVKVLSTVHNIVKHHIGKHPEIEEVRFTSAPDEPSREKLYMRYAEKHGGITDPTAYDTDHVIPARSYRMSESFLYEAGDSALPFQYEGEPLGGEHRYSFKYDNHPYKVIIDHDDHPNKAATVQFVRLLPRNRGTAKLTGDARHTAVKILSTMHNIVKHHVSQHPEIKEVHFSSDSSEPSRVKLYTRYTEKHNGYTEPDKYDTTHVIPASSYRKINESEDHPVRIRLGKPKGEQAQKFMVDFADDSAEHPFNPAARILHGSVVHVSRDGNQVHVHDIQTLAPKSGAGTKALKHLTSLADKHGVKLNLFAKAYSNRPEHIRSTPKLIKWYEKHGFKHDEPDYDPDYGSEMTYYPK